jgi:hypothetical protein
MSDSSNPVVDASLSVHDAVIAYAEFLGSADTHTKSAVEGKTAELVEALLAMWPAYMPLRKKKVVVACHTMDQEAFAIPLVSLLEVAEAKVFLIDFKSNSEQATFYSEPLPSIADILIVIAPSMLDTCAIALSGAALKVKPDNVVLLTPAYDYTDFSNIMADVAGVIGGSQAADLQIADAYILGISTDDWPSEDIDVDDEIVYAIDVIRERLADYRALLTEASDPEDPFSVYKPNFLSNRNMRDRWTWPDNVDFASTPEVIGADDSLEDLLQRYRPKSVVEELKSGLMARAQLRSENVAAARQNTTGARLLRWLGFGTRA